MAPRLTHQPMPVMTGSDDREGCLMFSDGQLVAVLVRLADEIHADQRGSWFVEAGFGPCRTAAPPTFDDLDAAQLWIRRQLGG
jgi:hypothetical protein